jgi:hypothetical protein
MSWSQILVGHNGVRTAYGVVVVVWLAWLGRTCLSVTSSKRCYQTLPSSDIARPRTGQDNDSRSLEAKQPCGSFHTFNDSANNGDIAEGLTIVLDLQKPLINDLSGQVQNGSYFKNDPCNNLKEYYVLDNHLPISVSDTDCLFVFCWGTALIQHSFCSDEITLGTNFNIFFFCCVVLAIFFFWVISPVFGDSIWFSPSGSSWIFSSIP